MKKVFKNIKLLAFFSVAAFLISCSDSSDNSQSSGVEIPAYEVHPLGNDNLPALVFNGKSNLNEKIKKAVKEPIEEIDVENIVFLLFDGLTEDLIESTQNRYADGLLLTELPQTLSLTAATKDSNTTNAAVIANYIETTYGITNSAYITSGSIVNDVFRQFRTVLLSTEEDKNILAAVLQSNGSIGRPRFVLGKDDEAEDAASDSSDLNNYYKSTYAYVDNFKDAVNCYKNENIEFSAAGHETVYSEPRGLNVIYSPSSTEVYPSPLESVAYGLAYMQTKKGKNGFYAVYYDQASGEDKQAELKNFDEAVIAASKYVLENPDTILVVTSASLDGSTKVPAYVLGNVTEDSLTKTTLIDFVKTAIKTED